MHEHVIDSFDSLFADHVLVREDGLQQDVPSINFSDFLARNFRPEDTVIVRCDIEGAEYEVLKSLIVAGTARLIDYLDVEWHAMSSPSLHHFKEARKRFVCACVGCC
jgi:FkbM family methyltransferase